MKTSRRLFLGSAAAVSVGATISTANALGKTPNHLINSQLYIVSETLSALPDATSSILSAINSAISGGASVVQFPGTTYLVDGLNLPGGVTYIGQRSTLFKRKNSSSSNFVLSFVNSVNFSVLGLIIDGNQTNQSVAAHNLVLTNCGNYKIDSVESNNAFYSGGYGSGIIVNGTQDGTNLTSSSVINCSVSGCGSSGIFVLGSVSLLSILNNNVTGCGGAGISVVNSGYPPTYGLLKNITISNNICVSNQTGIAAGNYISGGTSGAPVYGPGNQSAINITIEGNICNNNTNYGLACQVAYGVVNGNQANNNGGTSTVYAGILANCSYTEISGNTCNGNEFYGIDAGGAFHAAISDNLCIRNGANSSSGNGCGINLGACRFVTCSDNTCDNNGSSSSGTQIALPRLDGPGGGVCFGWEAQYVVIKNNTLILANTNQVAISVTDDAQNITITGNKAPGATASNQYKFQTSGALIRGNVGDEANLYTGLFATGTTSLTTPDWTDEVVIATGTSPVISALYYYSQVLMLNGVWGIRVQGATGWTVAPTVSFTGGGGTGGAAANALLDNAGGLWIQITAFGSYTSQPTMVLTGGNGTITGYTVLFGSSSLYNGRKITAIVSGGATFSTNALYKFPSGSNIVLTNNSVIKFRGYFGRMYTEQVETNLS